MIILRGINLLNRNRKVKELILRFLLYALLLLVGTFFLKFVGGLNYVGCIIYRRGM